MGTGPCPISTSRPHPQTDKGYTQETDGRVKAVREARRKSETGGQGSRTSPGRWGEGGGSNPCGDRQHCRRSSLRQAHRVWLWASPYKRDWLCGSEKVCVPCNWIHRHPCVCTLCIHVSTLHFPAPHHHSSHLGDPKRLVCFMTQGEWDRL